MIFYSRDLKPSEILGFDCGLSVKDLVLDYVEQKMRTKQQENFICNVVSNIFVEFKDGFIVDRLRFTDV